MGVTGGESVGMAHLYLRTRIPRPPTKTTKAQCCFFSELRSCVNIEVRRPSWAFRPNEPYGFCGRKTTLNRASALVTACP